jgi:hypothetical protein
MSNTSYGLFRPTHEQVLAAFGDSRRALNITGGDIPAICYLLHNQDQIADREKPAPPAEDGIASDLRAWAVIERDRRIIAAWNAQDGKRTISQCVRTTGHCFETCANVLEAAGLIRA